MSKIVVLGLVVLFSGKVFAGNETHGGEIVFCIDEQANKVKREKERQVRAEIYKKSHPESANDPWNTAGVPFSGWGNISENDYVSGPSGFPLSPEVWDPNVIYTYTMWDHYETFKVSKLSLDMGPTSSTFMEKVFLVLNRLSKFDRVRASRYKDGIETFLEQMAVVPPEVIEGLVHDATPRVNPERNCFKAQFAVQLARPRPFEKKYLVNENFWTGADEATKAGLLLHEIIFADEIQAGAQDSDEVRYFNAIISSTAMAKMTPEIYATIVARTLKRQ